MNGLAPVGSGIVTRKLIFDRQILEIRAGLNGEVVQASNTRDMIFSVCEIINFWARALLSYLVI